MKHDMIAGTVSGGLARGKTGGFMPVPFKLDYVIERTLAEAAEEQQALKKLTGIEITAAEAQSIWPRILDHKWYISERLGRDVGLRVAAIDYFENIRSPRAAGPRRGALRNRLRRATGPVTLAA
jgi:hypothetical protein